MGLVQKKILLLAAMIIVGTTLALASVGIPVLRPWFYIANLQYYMMFWASALIALSAYRLARYRPARPFAFLLEQWRAVDWPKLVRGYPLVIMMIVFMPSFSAVKSAIPLFQDFVWDEAFMTMDRTIHGTDPWRLLQPILGFPIITSALSFAYHGWLVLIFLMNLYFAIYCDNRQLAYRYFISFLGLWTIGGMVMAVGFASVGPCFVEPIHGDTTYKELMAYLYAANEHYPVLVLGIQQTLLEWNATGQHGLGRGISAMPSMHVGLAFIFYLVARHVHKVAGWLFGAFFLTILVASVHLGYHYAVDGYAAILIAAGLWKGAKSMANAPDTVRTPQNLPIAFA